MFNFHFHLQDKNVTFDNYSLCSVLCLIFLVCIPPNPAEKKSKIKNLLHVTPSAIHQSDSQSILGVTITTIRGFWVSYWQLEIARGWLFGGCW